MVESLGARLKGYEKDFESRIDAEDYIVCRIDGHKFSKFTKGFKKPFDETLSNAMVQTTNDLVAKFGAVTGYTQSDEITLIFIPQFHDKDDEIINNQVFGGRIQKMVSLIAAFTTMKFNKHLEDGIKQSTAKIEEYFSNAFRMTTEEEEFEIKREIMFSKIGNAWFDARIYGVSDKEEAFNSLMWRVRDAEKNSRSMFAQTYCSHKSLLNKTGKEQVEFCKETTSMDWETIDDKYKYGVLVKKEKYEKIATIKDRNTGDEIQTKVMRTKTINWAEPLTSFSDEKVDLIIRKLK